MANPPTTVATLEPDSWTDPLDSIPILYEDEEEDDMGEASYHVETDVIFYICLEAHLQAYHPDLRVFANMNLYYKKDGPLHPVTRSLPYVSPDGMVVRPYEPLPPIVSSFTIGKDGPAPVLACEILSKRSAQQRDLHEKLTVYAKLKVAEYIILNPASMFVPDKLLLKRLQPDGTWLNVKDPDGGVTSLLGFRVILDVDDDIRLVDNFTGLPYIRPDEAQAEAKARRVAEERAIDAAEKLLRAKQHLKTEAEARRQAEQAQRQAEQHAQAEAEARRQAEENLIKLREELDRLRQAPGPQQP